jgi:hypothetical protein
MTRIPRSSKGGLASLLAAVLVWNLGHCPSAVAVPPAPYHLVYGLAKDPYGTPLSSANSFVILQSQSGVQLTGQIIPGLGPGVNYQIKVPMDAGRSAQLYRPDALVLSNAFTMLVVVGTATNAPIEMQGGYVLLGQSAQATKINLTLGTDSNNDGIPDQWEQAYLAALGLNIPLSSLNAKTVLAGGLTLWQAYLLGLPVFDPGVSFQLTLVGFDGNSPIISFPGMTGRSYTVAGSSDLVTWTPLSFNSITDAPGTPAQAFFYSPTIQNVQLRLVVPGSGSAAMFLRVLLQ